MVDLLTAVKSARTQPTIGTRNETEHLYISESKGSQLGVVTEENTASSTIRKEESIHAVIDSPEDALRTLRAEPDTDTLVAILRQLSARDGFSDSFHLASPGPLQAQIINTLISLIVPTFWSTLGSNGRKLLICDLMNVAALNALFSRMRLLCSTTNPSQYHDDQVIRDLLDLADHLLCDDDCVARIWESLGDASIAQAKRNLVWKEAISLLGSGKVVATLAQAEDATLKADKAGQRRSSRLSSGSEYAGWLGRNIATLVAQRKPDTSTAQDKAAAQLLSKALTLGYPTSLVSAMLQSSLAMDIRSLNESETLRRLTTHLPSYVKGKLFEYTLQWLSKISLDIVGEPTQTTIEKDRIVSDIAAYLVMILRTDEATVPRVASFLTDPVLSNLLSLAVRRACLAALAECAQDSLETLLEWTLTAFGDRAFIEHASMSQQETLAQTLLLAAGYLHRISPMAVLMSARSSSHMQGVSNRLHASSERARWLGMVIGTALSSLVDKKGSKMTFDLDDMKTEETIWYLGLVKVEDGIGTLIGFQTLLQSPMETKPRRQKKSTIVKHEAPPFLNGKPVFGPPRPTPSKAVQTEVIGEKVTEVFDEDSDDAEDLRPYTKPDSDPEDSDEDATLVNRNKSRPPVYIRTLMEMLRDDKNHDRFQLGIRHAAPLIRRKANFGAEVKDHAEELLRTLSNLQDPFDTDEFDELRLQALIAVMLTDIGVLAPWLSRQAFSGDYSIAQRSVMLSALGLGGRELAGFKEEDLGLNPTLPASTFPSKRLPPRLEAMYAANQSSVKRLESATQTLEHQLIKPMALQAADQSTSHLNAVKVRTFSSRMDVERTKRKPAANQLAKILGPAFFFPLISRYQQDLAAYGSSSVFASTSFVLITFLKTLALLLHASGPATSSLPDITAAFWDLLLTVRVKALTDVGVLGAVLFSLLTILEVNTDKRRIAEEQPKQLMETQQWVELVFERMGGSEVSGEGQTEEAKIRTLAAGVLVKTREVVEAYQKQLFGQVLE